MFLAACGGSSGGGSPSVTETGSQSDGSAEQGASNLADSSNGADSADTVLSDNINTVVADDVSSEPVDSIANVTDEQTTSETTTAITATTTDPDTELSEPSALFNRTNTRYLVQACISTGCVDSNELFITGTLEAAIGYLKASNNDSNSSDFDGFGRSVNLSGDGQSLAIGASGEDSAAIGVNGNQLDNSAEASRGGLFVLSDCIVRQLYCSLSPAEK